MHDVTIIKDTDDGGMEFLSASFAQAAQVAKDLRANPRNRKAKRVFNPPDQYNVGAGQTFFPHQAMTLEIMARQDRGQKEMGIDGFLLDVDMGGGKTRISIYSLLQDIMLKRCKKPLIVMPNNTITQQFDEILGFTAANSINLVVLASFTDNAQARNLPKVAGQFQKWTFERTLEAVRKAPPNTIFLTSYHWLANKYSGKNPKLLDDGSMERLAAKYTGNISEAKRKYPGFPFDNFSEAWAIMRKHYVFCQWFETMTEMAEGSFWTGNDPDPETVMYDELLSDVENWKVVRRRPFLLLESGIDAVFLDESHNIRNANTFNEALWLFDHPQVKVRRLASGTVMPRDPRDLLRQLAWAFPLKDSTGKVVGNRITGPDEKFYEKYCEADEKGNMAWKESGVSIAMYDEETGSVKYENFSALKAIRKQLSTRVPVYDDNGNVVEVDGSPVYIGPIGVNLRREAWGFLLPDKKESVTLVPLRGVLRSLYNWLHQEVMDEILGDPKLKAAFEDNEADEPPKNAMVRTNILEMFLSSPDSNEVAQKIEEYLSSKPRDQWPERIRQWIDSLPNARALSIQEALRVATVSPKVSEVDKIITEHLKPANRTPLPIFDENGMEVLDDNGNPVMRPQQGKVLVFCNYIATAEHLLKHSEHKAKAALYSAKNREALDRFKTNRNVQVLFAVKDSIKEGHNLQMANCAIVVNLPWNSGDLDQMLARVYRPRQKFLVNVHHILTENTMEGVKFARLVSRRYDVLQIASDFGDGKEIDVLTGQPFGTNGREVPSLTFANMDEYGSPSAIKPFVDNYLEMQRYEALRAEQMEPEYGREMYDLNGGALVPGFPIAVPTMTRKNEDGDSYTWGGHDGCVDISAEGFNIESYTDKNGRRYAYNGQVVQPGEEVETLEQVTRRNRELRLDVAGEQVHVNINGTWVGGEVTSRVKVGEAFFVEVAYSRLGEWNQIVRENGRFPIDDPSKLIFPRSRALPIGTNVRLREGHPTKSRIDDSFADSMVIIGYEWQADPDYVAAHNGSLAGAPQEVTYNLLSILPRVFESVGGEQVARSRAGGSIMPNEDYEQCKVREVRRRFLAVKQPADGTSEKYPDNYIDPRGGVYIYGPVEWEKEEGHFDELERLQTEGALESMLKQAMDSFDTFKIMPWVGKLITREVSVYPATLSVVQQEEILKEGRQLAYYDPQPATYRSMSVPRARTYESAKKMRLTGLTRAFGSGTVAYVLLYDGKDGRPRNCIVKRGKLIDADGAVVEGSEVWTLLKGANTAKHRGFYKDLNLNKAKANSAEGLPPWTGTKSISGSRNDSLDFAAV